MFEFDVLVQQENLHILGAVRKQLDVDLRVAPRGTVEYRSGQIRREFLQNFHDRAGFVPKCVDPLDVFVALEEALIGSQFGFDLGVFRKIGSLRKAEAVRRLALGDRVVADTAFGDQSGGGAGDERLLLDRVRAVVAVGHGVGFERVLVKSLRRPY